jgi:uncharacterized LabA/DUF88 family protein
VDGQNLFHAVRERFGYPFPNYDVLALAAALCARQSWILMQVRFYTGVPDAAENPFWHHFWSHKLAAMGRQGIIVFSRPLRYRTREVILSDGSRHTIRMAEEKGIDVRIALDVIALAHRRAYDIASAFPVHGAGRGQRGINGTDWVTIDRALYDRCLDRRDYRPR